MSCISSSVKEAVVVCGWPFGCILGVYLPPEQTVQEPIRLIRHFLAFFEKCSPKEAFIVPQLFWEHDSSSDWLAVTIASTWRQQWYHVFLLHVYANSSFSSYSAAFFQQQITQTDPPVGKNIWRYWYILSWWFRIIPRVNSDYHIRVGFLMVCFNRFVLEIERHRFFWNLLCLYALVHIQLEGELRA